MSRKLIVNADDFGRSRGTSEGILRAHRNGIVTSTTAMMNLPGVTHDLEYVQREAPQLALGVHLTFTAGRPLLPPEWVPSLIDAHGHFLSQEVILSNPMRLNLDELKAELKAQIATFRNALGHLPDHLDAHHFVHVHPYLFRVYLELAEDFKRPIRVPFPRQPTPIDQVPALIMDVSPATLESLLQANWQMLSEVAIKSTDHFSPAFYGANAGVEQLLNLLDNLPDGVTELMTHPGLADEALKTESSYNVEREKELAVLTDPQVSKRLEQLGIELVTFAAVA